MIDYPFEVAANGRTRIHAVGNFVRVESSTGQVLLEAPGIPGIERRVSAGSSFDVPDAIDYIDVVNESGGAITGVLVIGIGRARSDTVTGSVEVTKEPAPGSTDTIAQQTVPAAKTSISPADANKLGSWIQANINNPGNINIGNNPTVLNGYVLSPGAGVFWPGSMEIFGYGGAGIKLNVEDVFR